MKPIILTIHFIVTLTLIGLILMQNSKGGLGSAFGGGEWYRTKRGAEKIIFMATIIATVIFLGTSIASLL
ncbi:preprotein translocase subunit SecG [Candidatus Gottesmanbacteria bacterium]|nr:preprotein translocase subunit SecG [Candidatus Gottesmanbacteria bacterium]